MPCSYETKRTVVLLSSQLGKWRAQALFVHLALEAMIKAHYVALNRNVKVGEWSSFTVNNAMHRARGYGAEARGDSAR